LGQWVESGAPVGATGPSNKEVAMIRVPKKVLFRIAVAVATLIGLLEF